MIFDPNDYEKIRTLLNEISLLAESHTDRGLDQALQKFVTEADRFVNGVENEVRRRGLLKPRRRRHR